MKIAVISPSEAHLSAMCSTLDERGHSPCPFSGGKTRVREIAERERFDLILVDGICCEPNELAQVEHVTTHHPETAVILLCATTSPEFLIHSMRAGVREVLPSPVAPPALLSAVDRVESKLAGRAGRKRGQVIAFMGAKGGSGSTFLATNLGWHLAETRSVLLIDLNLQFGDALSFLHEGRPAITVADVAKDIERLDGSMLAACTVKISPKYSVLAAPEDLSHAIETRPEHINVLLSVAEEHYDFVLLDLGRMLDPLTIQALDRATRIFLVMQAALPDLRHAAKLLEVFRTLGYSADKPHVILNRFHRAAEIGLDDVQRALGTTPITTVVNSYRDVSAAITQGDPLARLSRSSAVARQLGELARSQDPQPEATRGLLQRFLKRA